jgi:glycosyltransferase involved in cell wall biosynthesis
MDQNIPPLVSVICIAYNHEKYIRKAIKGFLMQRTDFRVEFLIHDDASTDHTAGIIREYEARDERIKAVIQVENQFSQGINPGINRLLPMARGKYVAFCEGDDYWTDPTKLQRQVDFLESHPDYYLCFHRVRFLYQYPCLHSRWSNRGQRETTSITDLCRENYIYTASVVYRNLAGGELPAWIEKVTPTDWPLFVLIARHGKIKYFNDPMAAYRIHQAGLWGGAPIESKWRSEIEMLRQLGAYLDRPDCQQAIDEAIRERKDAIIGQPRNRTLIQKFAACIGNVRGRG